MSNIDKDFEMLRLHLDLLPGDVSGYRDALARIEFEYDKRALEVDELRLEVAECHDDLNATHDCEAREAKPREELTDLRELYLAAIHALREFTVKLRERDERMQRILGRVTPLHTYNGPTHASDCFACQVLAEVYGVGPHATALSTTPPKGLRQSRSSEAEEK